MTASTSSTSDGSPGATGELKSNALGVSGLTFLVVSAAAPLTVMAGVAPLAISIGGVGAPATYLIAGACLIVFAVAFMGMSRYVAGSGGFYSYITLALGKHVGLGAAVLAVVSYNAIQIGLYGLFGVQAAGFVATVTGVSLPWWLFAAVAIAAVWYLGYTGIDVGAKVLGVLLVAETLILVIFAVGVLANGGASGLSLASFNPSAVFTPGVGAVLGIAFAAFLGFEATALYRKEARHPDRTIPRATYIAVGFMGVFYTFIAWVAVQAYGSDAAQGAATKDLAGFFFKAMTKYVGEWGSVAMNALLITSVFAALLAFHNSINRYTYSLAKDGIFPLALAHIRARSGSPAAAGLVQTGLAIIVVAVFAITKADPYLQLLLWVNSPGVIGILVLQALTGLSAVVFFGTHRTLPRAKSLLPWAVAATILMVVVTILLLSNLPLLTAAGLGVNLVVALITPAALAAGLIVAAVLKRRRPNAYARIGTAGADSLLAHDAIGLIESANPRQAGGSTGGAQR